MTFPARVAPTMPTRPCSFCLGLQDDGVFADFDIDGEERVFLRRISFDGYGCCSATGGFKKMNVGDSQVLVAAVGCGGVEGREVEVALRAYFRENSDTIWNDALNDHELL